MARVLTPGPWLALLLLLPLMAAADTTQEGFEARGRCGGFAPLVQECENPGPYNVGWFIYHIFELPTCGSSLTKVTQFSDRGKCFSGIWESQVTGLRTGDVVIIRCAIQAYASTEVWECRESGYPPLNQPVKQACRVFMNDEDPTYPGWGEWRCVLL